MRVASLWKYPVKGLQGIPVDRSAVERVGLKGDRRWMIVDRNNVFVTARVHPALLQVTVRELAGSIEVEHERLGAAQLMTSECGPAKTMVSIWRDRVKAAMLISNAANDLISELIGQPLRFVWQSSTRSRQIDPNFSRSREYTSLSDGFPILIAGQASLDDLNGRLAAPIPMERFRPNIVVEGFPPWGEDTWRTVQVGKVKLRVVKPCSRCVITTLDHLTGQKLFGNEPLETLGTFHRDQSGKIIFGQNAIVERTGNIGIGDDVTLLESGRSNLLA
jgi:uncharacterized protein YcbX